MLNLLLGVATRSGAGGVPSGRSPPGAADRAEAGNESILVARPEKVKNLTNAVARAAWLCYKVEQTSLL